VSAATSVLLEAPNWKSPERSQSSDAVVAEVKSTEHALSEILAAEANLYDLEDVINYSSSVLYCVENFVDFVYSTVCRYESHSPSAPKLPHGELLVPLGAMKVVLDAVFKKVRSRVNLFILSTHSQPTLYMRNACIFLFLLSLFHYFRVTIEWKMLVEHWQSGLS
jgi:hypothetical protein